jgi:hypothetical protein
MVVLAHCAIADRLESPLASCQDVTHGNEIGER